MARRPIDKNPVEARKESHFRRFSSHLLHETVQDFTLEVNI